MRFQSINPATGKLMKEFDGPAYSEILEAAKRCQASQKKWGELSVQGRTPFLKKLAELLRANLEEYAKTMTLEMGKPITQSRAEVEKCAWLCDFYAEDAAEFLAQEEVKTDARQSRVRFDPLGIVLCIMPWNFPFWQVIRFAAPALAAGNGVILKHASNVPACSIKLGEIFRDTLNATGADEELFQAILMNSDSASKLIESPFVAAVSLTGSTAAGSKVAEIAGKNIKKCVLELGGSDPFIVLADADLETACQTALQARTINTGQSCIAAKRFIIEHPVYEAFEKKMIELFKTLKMGDPMDPTVTIGPLAKAEIRADLECQVKDAVQKGAKILAEGPPAETKAGFFFPPVLLTNVTPEMAVYREETFGPIMTLFPVENADEAITLANNSEYGLGASLWTKDLARAEELAAQLDNGAVTINGMVKSDPRMPFGGVKKSGYGRELGKYGIREFVNVKSVTVMS